MTPRTIRTALRTLPLVAAVFLLAAFASAADTPPGVDARADEVMRRMATFLAAQKRFSVTAEEIYDLEVARAYRVELSNVRTLTVERPSRFMTDVTGDTAHRASWYDGRTLTVFNKHGAYTTLEMPGTIDAVLDKLAEDYEVVLPLSDFFYADPYATLMEGVLYGKYLGLHQVEGVPCHHLTFGQEGLYWQIWVDTSADKPLPRKVALSYWDSPGVPRYEATFKVWNLKPTAAAALFQFKAPAGAQKVELAELVRRGISSPK